MEYSAPAPAEPAQPADSPAPAPAPGGTPVELPEQSCLYNGKIDRPRLSRRALSKSEIDALGRGFLGEGQGENLGRSRSPLGNQPCNSPSDGRRLPSSDAGHDQEGTVAMCDGFALCLIQIGQEIHAEAV